VSVSGRAVTNGGDDGMTGYDGWIA